MWAWALEDVGKDDADVKWDWVGQRLNGCFSQWLFQPIAVTTCILEAKAVSKPFRRLCPAKCAERLNKVLWIGPAECMERNSNPSHLEQIDPLEDMAADM